MTRFKGGEYIATYRVDEITDLFRSCAVLSIGSGHFHCVHTYDNFHKKRIYPLRYDSIRFGIVIVFSKACDLKTK